jgi:hypothetical protein
MARNTSRTEKRGKGSWSITECRRRRTARPGLQSSEMIESEAHQKM